MRRVLICSLLCVVFVSFTSLAPAMAQGPGQGASDPGVAQATDNFPSEPEYGPEEGVMREVPIGRIELGKDPADLLPPLAPAGSNEADDPSPAEREGALSGEGPAPSAPQLLSCTTTFAGIRYTGRTPADPGLQPSAELKGGEANYVKVGSSSGRYRWGDYSGIAVDPADPTKVWMFAEYAASPANTWGTFFGQVSFGGAAHAPNDFDGDGKTDIAVWRPDTGIWYAMLSGGGGLAQQWGAPTDVPVPGDYDGDGKTDIAVWRPSTGVWYIRNVVSEQWGASTDVPVPGDYDGDGKTDIAVWRPSTGVWYVLPSSAPGTFTQTQWGAPTDVPVPGDYDGDGKTDIAVWRPSTGVWYVRNVVAQQWGASTDIPVPGDYDGDGKTDIAVWRPDTGIWYVRNVVSEQWGAPTDVPLSPLTPVLRAIPKRQPPQTFRLSVTKAGTGSGTVTSSPGGINCGTDCSEDYTNGTVVTLTAIPGGGSSFTGWSGSCSGTGTCTIIMNADKSVTATFGPEILNIDGTWSVTGSLSQTSCQSPGNNFTTSLAGTIQISQSGTNFQSTFVIVFTSGTNAQVTFIGTIGLNGQLNGTFSGTNNLGWQFSGSFTGSATGNSFSLQFSGQITVGESCHLSGSLAGTR